MAASPWLVLDQQRDVVGDLGIVLDVFHGELGAIGHGGADAGHVAGQRQNERHLDRAGAGGLVDGWRLGDIAGRDIAGAEGKNSNSQP